MDNTACFSTENTACSLAGFSFTDHFDCCVCRKHSYMRVIRDVVQRGRAEQLTAEAVLSKLNGTATDATVVAPATCKHRGALLQKGSCNCGDGNVWECAIIGKQIGKSCGPGKCTQYATA